MTADELAHELRTLGHAVRTRGDEVLLEHCPYCGNPRWNMEANAAKAVFNCWACRASGVLGRMLRDLGGDPDEALFRATGVGNAGEGVPAPAPDTPAGIPVTELGSAAAYLSRRGVRPADAARLGLTLCTAPGRYRTRIIVPLREYWDGAPVGFVARSYTGDTPKYLADYTCPASLPGWRLNGPVHVVTEGALDAVAVWRAGTGAACLLGLGHRNQAIAWAARAPAGDWVVVMLDGEAVKEAAALRHALEPVHERTVVAALEPGTDPGGMRPAQIRRAIAHAVETHGGGTVRWT